MHPLTRRYIALTMALLLIVLANVYPLSTTHRLTCPNGHTTYTTQAKHFGLPVAYLEITTGDAGSCVGYASDNTDHTFLVQGVIIDLVPAGLLLMLANALSEGTHREKTS